MLWKRADILQCHMEHVFHIPLMMAITILIIIQIDFSRLIIEVALMQSAFVKIGYYIHWEYTSLLLDRRYVSNSKLSSYKKLSSHQVGKSFL